jgi:ribosome maturation factor RimP
MQVKEIEELIARLVEPLLADTGMTLVDVEYVREKDWYLRIFLDKPGGVEIDDCQLVSERLTEVLDAQEPDPIPEKYFLEVSSPGIDRPLKKDKDFEAAYGTKVDVAFHAPWEGLRMLTGILTEHDAEAIMLKKIIKGKELKNPVRIERNLIAVIRPHIDF